MEVHVHADINAIGTMVLTIKMMVRLVAVLASVALPLQEIQTLACWYFCCVSRGDPTEGPRMKSCRAAGHGRLQIYFNYGTIPFWSMHVAAVLGVIWCGFSWSGVLLATAMYYARMLLLSAGFHRYFSHRTYKTSRAFQLVLAVLGQTCTQKDALWWAANHRWHHRHSDG